LDTMKTNGRQETTGFNRRLAQWRVTRLIEHFASHQLLWRIDSFVVAQTVVLRINICGKNRQLLVAANR